MLSSSEAGEPDKSDLRAGGPGRWRQVLRALWPCWLLNVLLAAAAYAVIACLLAGQLQHGLNTVSVLDRVTSAATNGDCMPRSCSGQPLRDLQFARGAFSEAATSVLQGIAANQPVQPACILLPFPSTLAACSGAADATRPTATLLGQAAGAVLQEVVDIATTAAGNGRPPVGRNATAFSSLTNPQGTALASEAVLDDHLAGEGRVVVVPNLAEMPGSMIASIHWFCDDTLAPYKRATFLFPMCVPVEDGTGTAYTQIRHKSRQYLANKLKAKQDEGGYNAAAVMARLRSTLVPSELDDEAGMAILCLLHSVAKLWLPPASGTAAHAETSACPSSS